MIQNNLNINRLNFNEGYFPVSSLFVRCEPFLCEVIVFVPIPNFPNYQFNNETLEVKSISRKIKGAYNNYRIAPERILKSNPVAGGYRQHIFSKNGESHTFMRSWVCWLVNTGSLPPKGYNIDHIDNNKTNDHFSNLQLLTRSENMLKAYRDKQTN